jgi:hypothetical protein
LFPRDKWLRYGVLLVTAAVVTITPITIRNVLVFRSFIPLSLGTGIILLEGIADYDPERRFGLEQYDHLVTEQEARLHNRPDYAEDLFRPDGIQRERSRIGRAWNVISGNKLWFGRVMLRRAGKMLTYEPVAIISTEPSVSHPLNTANAELAWRATPGEVLATNPSNLIFLSDGGVLRIVTANSPSELTREPIKTKPRSDYVLNVPVTKIEGRLIMKIVEPETSRTLASATIPDSLLGGAPIVGEIEILQMPFVNTNADQLKLTVANAGANSPGAIEVGTMELHRLGSASYLWTKYPRVVAKVFQKLFTTRSMLPLTLAGALLLAFARRWDALAAICAVPLYFIFTHAPLHLEPRYILPINYFWGMLVATALYLVSISLWKAIQATRAPRKP